MIGPHVHMGPIKKLVMKNTGKLFIWPFVQLVIILFLHLDRLNRSIGLRAILPRTIDFHSRPAPHIPDYHNYIWSQINQANQSRDGQDHSRIPFKAPYTFFCF